ncbi:hypothetical protein H4R35_003003 [Dimargaris xerosporica]|nr:hypothetical protein H4R35_003003 [Dimargaris xerosporica]
MSTQRQSQPPSGATQTVDNPPLPPFDAAKTKPVGDMAADKPLVTPGASTASPSSATSHTRSARSSAPKPLPLLPPIITSQDALRNMGHERERAQSFQQNPTRPPTAAALLTRAASPQDSHLMGGLNSAPAFLRPPGPVPWQPISTAAPNDTRPSGPVLPVVATLPTRGSDAFPPGKEPLTLRELLDTYHNDPELLKIILPAKTEEDRWRAEEVKRQTEQIRLEQRNLDITYAQLQADQTAKAGPYPALPPPIPPPPSAPFLAYPPPGPPGMPYPLPPRSYPPPPHHPPTVASDNSAGPYSTDQEHHHQRPVGPGAALLVPPGHHGPPRYDPTWSAWDAQRSRTPDNISHRPSHPQPPHASATVTAGYGAPPNDPPLHPNVASHMQGPRSAIVPPVAGKKRNTSHEQVIEAMRKRIHAKAQSRSQAANTAIGASLTHPPTPNTANPAGPLPPNTSTASRADVAINSTPET